MSILKIKFVGFDDPVEILLEENVNVDFFSDALHSLNRPADDVGFIGTGGYSLEKILPIFLEHAQQAKKIFNFDWDIDVLSQENFNLWHRDIETLDLSHIKPYPFEKFQFFASLHNVLHNTETAYSTSLHFATKPPPERLQVKWFEKSSPWLVKPKFDHSQLNPGDVVIDYPHVGKSPMVCLANNDNSILRQSCRLPDACPRSFHIILVHKGQSLEILHQRLVQWYNTHEDQLKGLFTIEDMLNYAGEYKIGTLVNKNLIPLLQNSVITGASIVS
jgi:hypothetical protein